MSTRALPVAVAVIGALALASPPASAKVWFGDLGGRELRWGQRVSTTILGCPGNDSCRAFVEGEVVYLRRGSMSRTGIAKPSLRKVGRIDRDGRLSFRVPKVKAGRHHLVAWVGDGAQRRAMPVSGTFRVVRSATAAARPPRGAPATCRHQSSAGFDKSPRNLVIGPLVLVGAREYSSPEVIAMFGGQKYPALVLAGHRVTVELPRAIRRTSLFYADDHWAQPDGERTVADGHRVVDFRACSRARSGSSYDGRDATFWSGFMLTTVPRCLALRVWVDDEPTPRHARIPLGKRCS